MARLLIVLASLMTALPALAGQWQSQPMFQGKHCSFGCESRVPSAGGYFYYDTLYWVEEGCEVEEPGKVASQQCRDQCIDGRECFVWRHYCTEECRR
jgi:hypothetical protein